ncbi:DUF4390 domain-containing protein [Desulfoprunum benzoelyticum]|uniref:DUF4390 domain-containing protein n=1 Tax=Desulfoprunum benzoelyticum TaxID=1506996 RepID=A0A840V350_9BACT|nr:DUF4390 domain-containing protein [Desulfoprunum benzoelyticum]MBB5347561.1 hypothetical protein [Desulfoprunum benzoelyticum]MBM9531121.1 DUF4390 domain-containing protein [Desulfoprunum benzoelyticum]
MLKRIVLLLLLIALATQGLSPAGAEENEDAAIVDLTATGSDTHLLLFGSLRNSFTEEMLEGLHSGLPIRFSFFIELRQRTGSTADKVVVSQSFTHTLTYDILKEIYRVELEEDRRSHAFASLLDAQSVLNDLNGIKVIELSRLSPDAVYTLQVKAELFNKTLPLSLQHVVPFVSWWDIKTDWHTLTFKLGPPDRP